MHKKPPPLYKHQKESIAFFRKQKRRLDGSDPGTGKTRVAIEEFAARRAAGEPPALILATKSLLRSAWYEDIQKFAPNLKVSIAYAQNREKAFAAAADVYITNHDAAAWLVKQPASFFKRFKGGTLIVDESSAFKHATSQRSKALAKIRGYFDIRHLMSGTPNTNGITDIWHQMFLLDDGKALGKSFLQFRSAVCVPQQVGPGAAMVKWQEKEHSSAIVSALIKHLVIRHKFEDCVDIPANHQYSVPYELSPKHMAAYKQLEDDSVLMLKKSSVTAINAAVLYGKLLQASSGAVYNDDGEYSLLDTDRYDMVLDLVEEREHSIVFFNWAHQRDQLIALAKKRGVTYTLIDGSVSAKKREEAVEFFQAGFYRVMFAHPQSAGHGLTLTKGTATIWASPTHNLEHYLQGLKRVHRIGQTQKTETVMLVAPGTIEERVYESLLAKDVKMSTLLNYLKEAA